jgi:CubicO group peptidase (beta-lactamase class C family)
MGKSTTAALLSILIREGVYDLWQPASIPEWQKPGDPRSGIRTADLMRMSSGLGIKAPLDLDLTRKARIRALFDKIGIRTMVIETDPFANFLTQGVRPCLRAPVCQ